MLDEDTHQRMMMPYQISTVDKCLFYSKGVPVWIFTTMNSACILFLKIFILDTVVCKLLAGFHLTYSITTSSAQVLASLHHCLSVPYTSYTCTLHLHFISFLPKASFYFMLSLGICYSIILFLSILCMRHCSSFFPFLLTTSLSMICSHSDLFHVVPNFMISFFSFYSWIRLYFVYVPQCAQPSDIIHRGCFQILAVVTSPAINIACIEFLDPWGRCSVMKLLLHF